MIKPKNKSRHEVITVITSNKQHKIQAETIQRQSDRKVIDSPDRNRTMHNGNGILRKKKQTKKGL